MARVGVIVVVLAVSLGFGWAIVRAHSIPSCGLILPDEMCVPRVPGAQDPIKTTLCYGLCSKLGCAPTTCNGTHCSCGPPQGPIVPSLLQPLLNPAACSTFIFRWSCDQITVLAIQEVIGLNITYCELGCMALTCGKGTCQAVPPGSNNVACMCQ